MKATFSADSEFFVYLTHNEINRLESQLVHGYAEPRETPELQPRVIDLVVNEHTENHYVRMSCFPYRSYFESIRGYLFEITPAGYELLRRKRALTDRPGCFSRIHIRQE